MGFAFSRPTWALNCPPEQFEEEGFDVGDIQRLFDYLDGKLEPRDAFDQRRLERLRELVSRL
jgi:hypothetical protein